MLKGYLTGMLSKELREKGYSLTEDEDFLYLALNGEIIKVYSIAGGITINKIEEELNANL
jgi:hypothetical protein